ncbi:MAG: PQQ-binding-like beta-propeller repeat protein [Thermomicrobiales bacterium]
MADPRSLRQIQQFWEAIALGRPAAPGDLDPELAALIQRLHATPDVPPPDPDFAKQLREDLMHAATFPLSPGLPPPNGRVREAVAPGAMPPISAPRRAGRAWPLAQAAIILLLIAAMLAGTLVLRRPPGEPTFAPSVATPVPAATSDWPMYKANPSRTSSAGGAGPVGAPVAVWEYHANGPISRSPAVVDGVAYLQSGDGLVTALNAATGDVLWQNGDTGTAGNTPAVASDTVFLSTLSGELVALDGATGAERWRFGSALNAECQPVVLDGVVYMGSDDGKVYAVDAATGEERWKATISGGVFRSLTIGHGLIFAGTSNGHLDALDLATGAARWQWGVGDDSATVGTPTLAGDLLLVNANGVMHALQATTGAQQWQKEFGGARPSAYGDGMIFSGGADDGVVYAIDAATGADRWTFPTGDSILAAPALVGGVLYVASFDQNLYALDAATGAEQWNFEIDGGVDYGPSVANGMVYVSTDAGTLYAIGGSGTSQLNAPIEATPATPAASPIASPGASTVTLTPLWRYVNEENLNSGLASLSLAPDGAMWVVDGEMGGFLILSPGGEALEPWGTYGDGPGEFNFLRDQTNAFGTATFAPDGSFYVADSHNFRIQHFDADRTFLSEFGSFGEDDGEFREPIQVLIGPDGNLYVIDTNRSDIQVFTPDGAFLRKFGGYGSEPGQMDIARYSAFDAEGNLWVPDTGNNRMQKFSPAGELLQTISFPKGDPGALYGPTGVALDAAGRIWVGDFDGEKVVVYAPDGAFLFSFDGTENGGTAFEAPDMLLFDAEGNLWVQDYGPNEAIYKFAVSESASAATPAPVTAASVGEGPAIDAVTYITSLMVNDAPRQGLGGLAVAADGTVYVTDSITNLVYRFDKDGNELPAWGGPDDPDHQFAFGNNDYGAGDIRIAPDGSIYTIGMLTGIVQKFSPEGKLITAWGGSGTMDGEFSRAGTLAIAPNGDIYVADAGNGRIQVFGADGKLLRVWGEKGREPGQLQWPWQVAFRPDGTLLVADIGKQVFAYTTDGEYLGTVVEGDPLKGDADDAYSIITDAAGRIFLADYLGNQIRILAPDGSRLAAWGKKGDGAYEFTQPSQLALDDAGRLYIPGDNKRVDIYQLAPPLIGDLSGGAATPAP